MTEDCNKHLVQEARANVAERYVQPYHKNAIIAGDWDTGSLVSGEIERLLKQPPIMEGEEEE